MKRQGLKILVTTAAATLLGALLGYLGQCAGST
jgi:hypothetical protein